MAAMTLMSSSSVAPAIETRTRLVTELDLLWGTPAIWISGPPESGKTHCMAAYAEMRNLSADWYTLDRRMSGRAGLRSKLSDDGRIESSFPLNRHIGLKTLATRIRRARQKRVIIIDNCNDIESADSIYALICDEFRATLGNTCLVVIGTAESAPAHGVAGVGQISRLTWDSLRLTLEETAALTDIINVEAAQLVHTLSDGLIMSVAHIAPHVQNSSGGPHLGSVHEWAACSNFDSFLLRANVPHLHDFIMSAAFSPFLTPGIAAEVTGYRDAADILAFLCRINLWIELRMIPFRHYVFHRQFRSFLLDKARATLTSLRIEAIEQCMIDQVLDSPDIRTIDLAIEYLAEANDWPIVSRVIAQIALRYLQCGQYRDLLRYIGLLPESWRQATPELMYWIAESHVRIDPQAALPAYDHVLRQFSAVGDLAGQVRSAAGAIHCCVVLRRFAELPARVAALDRLYQEAATSLPDDAQGIYSCCMVMALPCLPQLSSRSPSLLVKFLARHWGKLSDPYWRIMAATCLVEHYCHSGKIAIAQSLVRRAVKEIAIPGATPLSRSRWHLASALTSLLLMDNEGAFASLNAADEIAKRENLDSIRFMVELYRIAVWLRSGEYDAAAYRVSEIMAVADDFERALSSMMLAWLAAEQNDTTVSADERKAARHAAKRVGVPAIEAYCEIVCSIGAREGTEKILTQPSVFRSDIGMFYKFQWDFYQTALQLATGGEQCIEQLRAVLRLGRKHRFTTALIWARSIATRLCATALQANIEPHYVQSLIRANSLTTNDFLIEAWPWPLRIYTLGALKIVKDGTSLRFVGKAQRKPLGLLGFIIARGGRNVSINDAIQHLWPDAEGDAGQRSFDSTIFRLRKLLDCEMPNCETAFLVSEHKISLNHRVFWVDVWALDQVLMSTWEKPGVVEQTDTRKTAECLLRLYRGHFLETEEMCPWMISLREKLRSGFIRAISRMGKVLEASDELDQAITLYRRGIEVDSLSEQLHIQMMECYRKQNLIVEAMNIYRRFRDMVSIQLNVRPSPSMEALFKTLQNIAISTEQK